ncbi:hypothetical protein ABBQ32_009154 [Trebouxia sp. C0010 RCD-2024]
MIKRRRSGPLLPYANIRPTKQSSSTTVAVKRLLMTTTVILVCLFSGHALFGVSSVPTQHGHTAESDTGLSQHVQLRERSARGLTEQDTNQEASVSPVSTSAPVSPASGASCSGEDCGLVTASQLHPQPPSMQTPTTLLLQQQSMNPSTQQKMQQAHQQEAEQLQQPLQESVHSQLHKQTLQQAHAEAQLHFHSAHTAVESPNLAPPTSPAGTGIYSMTVQDIDGKKRLLSEFANKVAVVVNVASQCGFTDSNYKGLQFLYDKYKDYDFTVLAFPCNQFGQQESGTNDDIKQFVRDKYGVTFPMFSKVDVNGPQTSQLFSFLKQSFPQWLEAAGTGYKDLDWNFNKFLVGRNGVPIKHYTSELDYAQLEQDVYNELLKT